MTPPQDPREYFSDRLPVWLRAASDRFEKTVPDPTEFEAFIAERVGSETLSWIGWALKEELIAEDGDKFHPRDERGKAWQWFRNAPVREWPFGLMWENFIHVAFFARLWGPCRERKKTLRFELERQGTNEYAGKPNIYELDLAVEGADGGVDWYIELKEKRPRRSGYWKMYTVSDGRVASTASRLSTMAMHTGRRVLLLKSGQYV